MKDYCSTTHFLDVVTLAAMLCMAAGLPLASAAGENEEHRRRLLRDAYQNPAAFSPKAAQMRYVPTNTLAFREYALGVMLTQANHLNKTWQLGFPSPITTDHISRLAVSATIQGIAGGITISNRYRFSYRDGAFSDYSDTSNRWDSIERDSPRLDQLVKERSLITAEEAAKTASQALGSLGVVPYQFDLMDKPVTEQFQHYTKDDKQLPLPLFLVQWKASIEAQHGDIRMEVSGLTKKIVNYENYRTPPLPLPMNYFQMLGISPDRKNWGRQYGYDPMHSAAFEHFARGYAVEHVNRALRLWQLDAPRSFGTNDITWLHVQPHTNAPAIAANFTNRFYLQIGEGHLGLFEDKANGRFAFAGNTGKLNDPALMTNTLDDRTLIGLARKALHQLGLDETQLRLAEPPKVTQCDLPGPEPGQTIKLPLYDILWSFPPAEQPRFGESSAIGFQISAVTRRVTMYANNCPWAPLLPLPANYEELIGLKAGKAP